jgi:hypothetical protein
MLTPGASMRTSQLGLPVPTDPEFRNRKLLRQRNSTKPDIHGDSALLEPTRGQNRDSRSHIHESRTAPTFTRSRFCSRGWKASSYESSYKWRTRSVWTGTQRRGSQHVLQHKPVKQSSKFVRSPFSEGQRKVQFCTLLQVPTRLYGDSRNLNSFTASLQLQ